MGKRILFIFLLALINASLLSAQNSGWSDHFSYRNALHVAETESYVATSCEMGIMLLDKLTEELTTYSRVNGLSDTDITAIESIANDVFIIGYGNGNIDILSERGILNIPDFKLKQIVGAKRINHFYKHEDKVYCSTDYALLVLDPSKGEISDTYFLGLNAERLKIYQTVVSGDSIYAATERGLLTASLSDPRIVFDEAWKKISSGSLPSFAVNMHGGEIVFVTKEQNTFKIIRGNENSWSDLLSSSGYKSLHTYGGKLVISLTSQVLVYDEGYNKELTIDENKIEDKLSVNGALYSSFEGAFFMADKNYGLVKYIGENNSSFYLVNRPYSNYCFELHSTEYGIYLTAGGLNEIYNNLDRTIEYSYYDINKNEWGSFKSSVPATSNTSRDLIRICSSQTDEYKVYMSSWGGGLYEVQGLDSIKYFGEQNGGLQDIYPDNRMYVRVGGVASDSQGNIWMSNAEVEGGIVVKSGNEWRRFDYETTNNLHSVGQMLITRDDYVWMTIPMYFVGDRQGIMVINTNGTLLDDKDDEYKSPAPVNNSSDERHVGQLRLWDENRKEITKVVLSMAEDKNGYIWLGTDKGVLVYYRPWAIFSEDYPVVSRIKVPRNDGSNLADYLLENERISCIAVDGANRKWIGTEDAGLYLVSEDGLKTYYSFNTENSPLPSNAIKSIAISPITGEVFIGTEKGILSYKAKATEGNTAFDKIYAYPNPVREDFAGDITITGLMQNSIVKITTVSGKLVHETKSLGGNAHWNGKNFRGEKVKTGVYIVYVSNQDGEQSGVTKILIVR
ncbi:T9SS type A sorting domain-containing protein [Carboxylicivirga mesophila]|uniref:T9SS type A sorting domain-containing protein n=1 Tax=Carboxylicivirga mesophila TaxID=1166478 RepID=A0ABS5KDZ4_9BACT|nr:two-component regulator propeller domain-containing protein [Carboxylicivirga mesophila]MBS2213067.1 T9SS type A sorting domain-containing protein [Carboxylicivirga mesophila]